VTIPTYPIQLPPQNTQVLDVRGISQVFYNFVRVLFLRTGGASGIGNAVATGVVASGQTLTADYTAVSSGSSIVLANLQPGQQQTVLNVTGGGLTINPFGSGQIDGGASYLLPDTKTQLFTCIALINGFPSYRSLQLG
jgi:hypothetical protein